MRSLFAFLVVFITTIALSQDVENELQEMAVSIREVSVGTKMLEDMSPSMDDLQRIFVSSHDVSDAYVYIQYLDPTEIKPTAEQTEIAVHKLNGAELRSGVESQLPKEYYAIADHIKENISVYVVEYYAPEASSGYQLHAFFYVKEHWVFIPNAFEVFEE